ncbi:MAG: hypothetical protein V7L23_16765, partial [Nostoc sp.]|uniref:hypothetical protein n=1 Tax=Nostoc sp. TaxID=1180 RepID=UPI002FF242AD
RGAGESSMCQVQSPLPLCPSAPLPLCPSAPLHFKLVRNAGLYPTPWQGEGRQSVALAGWGSPGLISNQADMILQVGFG